MADVICRGCRGRFHETTAAFDPEVVATGNMFALKEPYRTWRWSSFPERPEHKLAALECPQCGVPYPDVAGKVLTTAEAKAPAEPKPPAKKKRAPRKTTGAKTKQASRS